MKRSELTVGMEVKLDSRWRHGMSDHALIIDLTPGWKSIGPKRPWTAFTDPDYGFVRPKHVDGTKVGGVVMWGDRFELTAKRNQNVLVAIEIRKRIDGTNDTEHRHWEPRVVPLSQVQQPWAQWQAYLTQQQAADAERNKALYAYKDERKARWERDLLPVLRRSTEGVHTLIDRLGMDYVDMPATSQRFHQFPASLLETLIERIVTLETQLDEARKALAP